MKDGIIKLDSDFGKEVGFTKNKFYGWLWKRDNMIVISFVNSLRPGQGNFSQLLQNIEKKGFAIGVPTPLAKMQQILSRKGFISTFVEMSGETVELWVKPDEKFTESRVVAKADGAESAQGWAID